MKELAGGMLLAGLFAAALGLYLCAGVLGIAGVLAGAASCYDEILKEKQAESWRAEYPSYKY
jgi:hypothetical protein